VTLATAAPLSAPAHARISLVPTTGATGAHGAWATKAIASNARTFNARTAYRLTGLARASTGTTDVSASILAIQSFAGALPNVLVQLEFTAAQSGGLQPRFQLRLYKGTTLLATRSLTDAAITVGEWQRLAVTTELAASNDRVFATVTRNGAPLLPRTSFDVVIAAGDAWETRIGGFSGAAPATHRPEVVHDFDDVVLAAGP
jgi:hypothetical protein